MMNVENEREIEDKWRKVSESGSMTEVRAAIKRMHTCEGLGERPMDFLTRLVNAISKWQKCSGADFLEQVE